MGEDGEHTRQRPGAARIDGNDPRMRVVGVAELGVELPRQAQVDRVPAGPVTFSLPSGRRNGVGSVSAAFMRPEDNRRATGR